MFKKRKKRPLSREEIIWLVRSGKFLAELDLGGADLSKANLGWIDLSNSDLREANLRWADLIRADLKEGGSENRRHIEIDGLM